MQSRELSFLSGRNMQAISNFPVESYRDLSQLGINFNERHLQKMIRAAMDSVEPLVTTASITTPVQFLQNWLPGFVHIITGARKIDELVGISTSGSWADEEIVQGIMELVGTSQPYGDYTNVPFSSWNTNFDRRTVVRFEEGLRVGVLEEERAARIRVDTAGMKRNSAALALEIQRNAVGFVGFNSGSNRTYGFLNDPGLPAYVPFVTGATSTLWATKTYLEIVKDIRTMVVTLRSQSQDQIDPENTQMTLALATDVVDYLSVVADFGNSVRDWLTKTYPKIRVVSAPELDLAVGGLNAAYLYAETIKDMSTDDGRTFMQVVPAKFQTLGVAQQAKSYEEDYTNATAGVACKRPWAVVRFSGN